MWWYNSWTTANRSNTLSVNLDWVEIDSINTAEWWWVVYNTNSTPQQIWAKWTISQNTLWKKYLTKDLYDPEVWDLVEKSTNQKLIEKWLWRYIYAVYKKPTSTLWSSDKTWTYYNIAYTVQKEWSDTLVTKIVWDYDKESCFENADKCPDTLIWSWSWYLVDWQEQWKEANGNDISWNYWSSQTYQWIPYPVSDFE
jgi:hypothetical protein